MYFRKKAIVIEALQWTAKNADVMLDFMPGNIWSWNPIECSGTLRIHTLEGTMTALPNDWIIRGVNGEYYPCKPDIFEKTYDKVDE